MNLKLSTYKSRGRVQDVINRLLLLNCISKNVKTSTSHHLYLSLCMQYLETSTHEELTEQGPTRYISYCKFNFFF